MKAPRVAGDPNIRELKPRYRVTAASVQIVVPFVGLHANLQAKQPAIGSTLPGYSKEFKVSEVTIEEGRSVEGRMVVTLEKLQSDGTGGAEPLEKPVYELEWGEERRKIEEHKKCGYLKPDRKKYQDPGEENGAAVAGNAPGKKRSWADWQALEESDYAQRSGVAGAWPLESYKYLKERGIDDFPLPFPIATATVYFKTRPNTTGGVFTQSQPPSECGAPSGWTYIKIADSIKKEGRLYCQRQAWRGYSRVDDLWVF